jgi:uncharacterized protein (DUF1778 family)
MPRPTSSIKNLTTSYRTTNDMKSYLAQAANAVGATEAEITRLAIYETAREILTNPQVQQDLKLRFAI